ncbi:hypothetical protein TBR22_A52420 [Luteitalea sp. TBR-22]|uniref:M1 family metallopeptidase n=1 Tax=Luteitalea sp. TBR-22 TaxID=2802971 RepID=UPI001AF5D9EF|nr:M1 family aminopeptidase [Luteitalea sp. TBR-22]BCS36005.1 hypothetical protein TBR22_A52420 [Luteitalea sp. TBR-22]
MRLAARLLIVAALCWATPAVAQPADTVGALYLRMERALQGGTPGEVAALFTPDADAAQVESLASESAGALTTRVVVRERDRQELGADGARILADILVETATTARVSSWRFDVGPITADPAEARVRAAARLSEVDGLVRLSLANRQFAVHDLTVRGEDFTIVVPSGVAWAAEVRGLITALVVVGEGEVTFAPPSESEKGQIRLVAGEDQLRARVSRFFLRVNPVDVDQRITLQSLTPMEVDRVGLEKARRFFAEQVGQSYSLDLSDLSRDTWNLVPPIGDVLVDMDLARYGQLTYARSGGESEDVSLFDRKRRKNVSVYTSARSLAQRGELRYNDEDRVDYVVEHYNVDVSFDPARLWIEGRADLDLRITGAAVQTLTLRLAEPLTLRAVTADSFGRLLALRVRGQQNIIVNLPDSVRRGQTLRLRVSYGGRLSPPTPDRESITAGQVGQQMVSEFSLEPEPRYVYSYRAYWYPQGVVTSFATARIRMTVPEEYTVLGSGAADPPVPVVAPNVKPRRAFVFRAERPVRYLSVAISRLVQVTSAEVRRPAPDPAAGPRRSRVAPGVFNDQATVEMWSQPRLTGRARELLPTVTDILGFYADVVDDLPFSSFRLALVEDTLPGGHSPAYFALLHQPMPGTPFNWARDPVAFDDFPQFFVAHELAHQFWGQTVAGENYHEQWLSEGFAQYFALLYAQKVRPRESVANMLRQLARTSMEAAEQGPIWLGYRIGHMKGDSRMFRSTVYNKSALVLHMLSRVLGPDAFSRGLQRFYGVSRYRRVGTDDLRRAMETEAGRPLDRFFDGWVYGADIPTVRPSWDMVEGGTAGADGQAPASGAVRLVLEQSGKPLEVPMSVTIAYQDGRTEKALAIASESVTEVVLPVTGRVRELRFNEDGGALVRIEKAKR